MDVSIIIVNYNTISLTLDCIKSIYEKTQGISYEIIVIDNNSNDDIDIIKEKYPKICIYKSKENLGFGRANNLGYKKSKGKYIFLLNPDTILINNAIFELYSFLNDHSEVAIAGGLLFDENMNNNISFKLYFPSLFDELNNLTAHIMSYCMDKQFYNNLRNKHFGYVSYVIGADMMIRREDIEKYGLFDPSFFMYFEETDLSRRYKKYGRKSAIIDSSKIIHLEGKSFDYNENRDIRFFDGRRVYYNLNHSSIYVYGVNSIYLITILSRLLLSFLLLNMNKQKFWWKRLLRFNFK